MKTFLAIVSFLVILSCNKDKSDDCPQTQYYYGFKVSSQVDTIRTSGNWLAAITASGDSLVFNYIREYTTCANVADGNVTDILFFQVDPAANSFEYDVADFQQSMVYFRRVCFCTELGFIIPQGGTIKGNRVNPTTWNVEFDLIIANNEHVKNSGTFVRD
jgi:hypothetical protein